MKNTILNTILNKNGFKIISNDLFKYYFQKEKISFNTINPWVKKTYSLTERQESLENTYKCLINNLNVHKNKGFGTFNLVNGWSVSDPGTSGINLSSLLNYYHQNRDNNLFEKITECADWLIQTQNPSGIWQLSGYEEEINYKSDFDTTQIINALVLMHIETKNEKYLTSAVKGGEYLFSVQPDERNTINYCNILIADSLAKLYSVTNNDKYKDFAKLRIDLIIEKSRKSNEFLFGDNYDKHSSLRIATIIDCLFNCGIIFKNQEYIDLSISLANSLFLVFNKKKYLPGEINSNFKQTVNNINLHGCAMSSVVWLKLYEHTKNIQYLNTSLKMNDFLISCQCRINDINIQGSIPEFFPFWSNLKPDWSINYFMDALILEQNCLKYIN